MASSRSFWKKPEGVTGKIGIVGLSLLFGYLLYTFGAVWIAALSNLLVLTATILGLAIVVYMAIDPQMRSLVSIGYQSIMRTITGWFIKMDPISVLRAYLEDMASNIRTLSKQIGELRTQMRTLKGIMDKNATEINSNLLHAEKARAANNDKTLLLSTRKAARLKESNQKYDALYQKMAAINKVLVRMYNTSEVIYEDTSDQIKLKEVEYKAIASSRKAMKGAMNVLDSNQKERLDQAMQAITDDLANKVGEMERFMDVSQNVMNSIDLQQATFADEGMKMLEDFDKNSEILNLDELDRTSKEKVIVKQKPSSDTDNSYDQFF